MLNSCVRASKVFTFRFINIFAAVRLSIFAFIVNCGVNLFKILHLSLQKLNRRLAAKWTGGEENRR